MDPMQIAIPVVGIVAAAVATFYVVSFAEIRDKSFKDFEEKSDADNGGEFKANLSSRERRAKRKADRQDRGN